FNPGLSPSTMVPANSIPSSNPTSALLYRGAGDIDSSACFIIGNLEVATETFPSPLRLQKFSSGRNCSSNGCQFTVDASEK
ncbi:MAG: hypothetical protein M1830_007870, partial [Pleopsidium flavum]